MKPHTLTHDELLSLLQRQCRLHPDRQGGFAKDIGVSAQYLSEVLNKHKPIGPKLAKALGFKRHFCYEPLP